MLNTSDNKATITVTIDVTQHPEISAMIEQAIVTAFLAGWAARGAPIYAKGTVSSDFHEEYARWREHGAGAHLPGGIATLRQDTKGDAV